MIRYVCQKCVSSKRVNPEINNVLKEYLYIYGDGHTHQLT